ncbi:ribonuclease P protein component [Brachyspira sp. SAP_772]|uniref:ribonuclease P protein component n=1 Tax=Brachyspira sp. SAP_772 TaxID=2608385 RepID=UPI0012F4B905|nr:ribonuclease P protein component [Brachyspira sp. SAP_772]
MSDVNQSLNGNTNLINDREKNKRVSFRLYRKEKLKNKKDIICFFNKNDNSNLLKYSNYFFTMLVKQNNRSYSRFVVTIKRNKANAVKRNRVKRIVREIYRTEKTNIPLGYDYFIIINRYISRSFLDYKKELMKLFNRI